MEVMITRRNSTQHKVRLTERQAIIWYMAAHHGLSDCEIASRLPKRDGETITKNTVDVHLGRLYRKLNLSGSIRRTRLTVLWYTNNLPEQLSQYLCWGEGTNILGKNDDEWAWIDHLTTREKEIAKGVAEGLPDAEIAMRCLLTDDGFVRRCRKYAETHEVPTNYLTEYTVATNLNNVYLKLDLTGPTRRAKLVVWWYRKHLPEQAALCALALR